ncbi:MULTISPECIES: phosphate acyltransferase PlsX [unclassified Mycoplasma]|uniref:phosphate acyltransferase PlsX n=1 Tax=unclassified Mycoplasma TaxID=2683645 RepID=UPI00211CBA8E|nr:MULTISPECIES: phosphate acyltransferase PlsX [unclassified Mycoplasma]UUM19778.1 phosphate acyltransferase PlsX [Mycoplasma sp. 1578d]UUM24761.1 phosphate acyltransferase PlsX [Mycoplasma sp. 3686d]
MYKYSIGFDVNGNDNGPREAYQAACEFAQANKDIKLVLVGDLKNTNIDNLPNNIELITNLNVPSDPKNIKQTLRENTSMNQMIDLYKQGKIDSLLSSGDSGSYISALTLKIGRLNGVSRPAFMPVANAINGQKFIFLDVGANLEVKSQWLEEWALLGSLFYKTMFNELFPKVTLLNIGVEDYKGSESVQQAHANLKTNPKINYVGFQETRDLFRGYFNVAIIDGYGGNLVLKSYEGAVLTLIDSLKSSINKNLKRKLGGLLVKSAFKDVMKILDYRNVGSAWVVGVKCLALKAHGSSDQKSYLSALNQLKDAMEKDLLNKMLKEIN